MRSPHLIGRQARLNPFFPLGQIHFSVPLPQQGDSPAFPLARLIHKLRLKNEFDLRIKGNWIFERCKATASGKASLEY